MSRSQTVDLMTDVTVTGAGNKYPPETPKTTFHVFGNTASGAGAATVKLQVSNVTDPDTNDFVDLGTVTLTLATTKSGDSIVVDAPWLWVRGNVTAISGTGAKVSIIAGFRYA